jgi:hypothetical protein
MGLAVIDIDGVLADVRHRLHFVTTRPKDWDGFFAAAPNDEPLQQGLARAWELADAHGIVYLTGRPERCRADTEQWLAQHGFPPGDLVMRPNDDRRPARLFKVGQVRRLDRSSGVDLVLDDDAKVVAAMRDAGFVIEQATWMNESPAEQATLLDVQEGDGRS